MAAQFTYGDYKSDYRNKTQKYQNSSELLAQITIQKHASNTLV